MKLLQRNKVFQIVCGFALIISFLWSGKFLTDKIRFLEISDASAIETAFCIIYPILFAVFMLAISLVSKKYSMELLFYPIFWLSFISGAAAYLICCLEGSVSLLFWGIFLIPLAKPLGDISKGMEKLLEYPLEYTGDISSYVYQWDFLVIFLGITLLSLIVYQNTVKTEKQREKYLKWRLDSSTEKLSKIIIGTFGTFAFLSDVYFALPYCEAADWLLIFLTPVALGLTMTFVIYILPIALCGTLIFKGIKQAKKEKSPRKILHPYIIAAIVSTLAGCNSIFQIAIESF